METEWISIKDAGSPGDDELSRAAGILRNGGLVAFPTETVYGLGANALDASAAEKIYAAKGRPSDNPLIVHISCMDELTRLVKCIPPAAGKLAAAFWPGPLTMVFPKADIIPYATSGGLDTVAVRMPSSPVANRLIALAGVPVAAPSANLSGRPSPTTAAHVRDDLDGRIDMIIDGGPVGIGVESTIVDVTQDVPVLLRPGAITMEMLEGILGHVDTDPAVAGPVSNDVHPKAPGMKYRHYAPKADLTVFEGEAGRVAEEIEKRAAAAEKKGLKAGVICTDETRHMYDTGIIKSAGSRADEDTIARSLFAVLREFDDLGVDVIFSESFDRRQIGAAIMNRLIKAAGYNVVKV